MSLIVWSWWLVVVKKAQPRHNWNAFYSVNWQFAGAQLLALMHSNLPPLLGIMLCACRP
jgi:hypothetical protein